MPVKNEEFPTLCYDNYPDQREFVFAIKGRPFSMLSSQKLSVPSTSLIDYKLVRDHSLKMDDLQCSKFSYGGQKLRILGKISQTVLTSGTIHLRASVVENLSKIFDSHSIAGEKMTEMLYMSKKILASSPSKGKSPVRTVSSPSSPSSSPAVIRSPAPSRPPPPSSPPGFPQVLKYWLELKEGHSPHYLLLILSNSTTGPPTASLN